MSDDRATQRGSESGPGNSSRRPRIGELSRYLGPMASHRRDESDDAERRDDKHRVEQSRIPAPPTGYSRIDSLDDLDQFPPATVPSVASEEKADAATDKAAESYAFDPAPVDTDAANIKPAKTRGLFGRRASAPVPGPVDGEPAGEAPATLEEEPLPETVPTEAVHTEAFTEPESSDSETEAIPAVHVETPVAFAEPAASDAVEVPAARSGEPYEEHAEALRSRRITELEDEIAGLKKLGRRGTTDLGLLVLRLAVGAYLAVDGFRKIFGWLGGPSLNGFETDLLNTPKPELGFSKQSAGILAMGWSVTEIVVGIVLIAGFLTPIIAAAGLVVASLDLAFGVTTAGAVHLFADQADRGGVGFQAALWVMLVVIILCGPGRYSLDGARGWARRPGVGSVVALLVGIAVAVAIWVLFNGSNPLASTGNHPG